MSQFNSRFQVLEKIGEGTFADVLKCCETSTGHVVAVKRLKKDFKTSREAYNLPELIVLRSLPSHPNVLTMVEHIFDPGIGKLFMVFELMEMNLYELMQKRKRSMPESKVKHLFYQILKGVEHLHSHGIFHRDIKPENILIKKAIVKLADLGSVRKVHSPQPFTEYISTRWYRAPECILGNGTYGPKMDIWACGCVFYELLTSKPLFPGADELDQLTRVHQVVGTPTPRVLLKMRQAKSRLADAKFAPYPSINFAIILPFSTEYARDLLKRMLTYDPDIRSNVKRLLDHKYFHELREAEFQKQISECNPYSPKDWTTILSQLNHLNIKKPRTRSNISKVSTATTKTGKLTTSSWAPETTSEKSTQKSVTQSKSKPNNQLLATKDPTPRTRSISKPSATKPEKPAATFWASETMEKPVGQNKSKPENQLSPQKPPTSKRKLLDRSPKHPQKTKPQVTETIVTKIPLKIQNVQLNMQDVKAKSVGVLPSLSKRQTSGVRASKSNVTGRSYKLHSKRFLPPIMEQ